MSQKCGNFQALLDFIIDAGDEVLKQHFETAPCNAMQCIGPKLYRMKS